MKKFAFYTVFLSVFLDILGFGIIIPLLPFYAQKFGANEWVIGMILASNALGQFIFNPIWGRLSDKVGRRPVLIISVAGSAVAYLLFGLANTIALLFISRFLSGISGATIGVAQAYIADVTTKEERSNMMGKLGAAFALGFVFGPALSALVLPFGAGMPGFIAAGLSFINFIMVLVFLPESKKKAVTGSNGLAHTPFDWQGFKQAIRHPEMMLILNIQFLSMFAMSIMFSTAALFLHAKFNYGERESAYVFIYFGICSTVVQGFLVGKLVNRLGELKVLCYGAAFITIGLALMPFSANVVVLMLVTTIIFVGTGVINPCTTSLISQKSRDDQVGVTLGVSRSLGSMSRIFGPLWGGYIFYVAGYHYPYFSGSAVALIVFFLTLKLALRPEEETPVQVMQRENPSS